ncbi:MAG: hypothetical protein JW945_05495 [Methanomicrobia archaeon]|nr:hypothetical protein [Methanomicrobia archaeon]
MNENKSFVSWSGGKDSSLACLRILETGCEVLYLLNLLDESGERERAHDIPLIQVNLSWEMYEPEFNAAVRRLKREGIERGVFGDIGIHEHRAWVERVSEELAIELATRVNQDWLGRRIDESFISELQKCDFHAAGESGAYHSFVINGPLFRRRIRVSETERVRHGDHWFLDIKRGELE